MFIHAKDMYVYTLLSYSYPSPALWPLTDGGLHGLQEIALSDILAVGDTLALCDFLATFQTSDGVVAGTRQVLALFVDGDKDGHFGPQLLLRLVVARTLFLRHGCGLQS